MADRAPPPPPPPAGIDSRSGFCAATRIFHSTRAPGDLPPEPVVAFAAPEVAAKLPGHVRCVVIGSDEYGRLAASDGRRR
uniref:Uncharacterized protein n=1 Tax=Oryza barthii TaxID=65489 RepID=A0A0D3EXH0_9ORYZ